LIPPFRYIWGALLAVTLSTAPVTLPAAHGATPSRKPPVLTEIHAWTNEIYTRVAIYTGEEVHWQADTVRADPAKGLPPRIFVDIRDVGIRSDILHNPVGVNNGLLRQVRAGRYSRDTVRVVIDLERQSTFRVFALPDPHRIIIDIDGEGEIPPPRDDAAGGQQASAGEAPAPERAEAPPGPAISAAPPPLPPVPEASFRSGTPAPSASFRRRKVLVMIDPGHGGKDPGAIGPTGLREKDVVLDIGRMVRDRLLRHEEFEVRMTRDSDVFIPLEERTAMANRSRADIFVSLHINASRNPKAKGISTFVFSRGASNREDLELAARENGVPVARLKGVKFIIDDMFTGARKNESLRLAKTMNDAICRSVSPGFGGATDLGLKQAPFFVLVGARMTSVLVESSFISNEREEALLREEAYRARIADGVVEAIRYYGRNAVAVRPGF
jgi:N-acetylmuramoyl-L-alanine amidase